MSRGCQGNGAEQSVVDAQPIIDSIHSASLDRIVRTIVVGLGASTDNVNDAGTDAPSWLSDAATSAGTQSQPNCGATGNCYFDLGAETDLSKLIFPHGVPAVSDCTYDIPPLEPGILFDLSNTLTGVYTTGSGQTLLVGRSASDCPDGDGYYLD